MAEGAKQQGWQAQAVFTGAQGIPAGKGLRVARCPGPRRPCAGVGGGAGRSTGRGRPKRPFSFPSWLVWAGLGFEASYT